MFERRKKSKTTLSDTRPNWRRTSSQRVCQVDYRANYFERTPKDSSELVIPRYAIYLGLALAVVLFLVWFFTAAPWLKVKDIRIDGEVTDESKAEIDKMRGQNILWLSVTKPERVITANQPSIKEIEILRGIPDTLRVRLIEREPAIIWELNGRWLTVDPSGFAFRQQDLNRLTDGGFDYPGTDLPVVVDRAGVQTGVGKYVVRPQFISFTRQLADRLPKEFQLRMIRGEIAETSFAMTVVTDAGWNILFDTTRSLDAQLRTLTQVLESRRGDIKEYIDLRVRGWVYFK